eukprot:GHVT01088155.1.p1 GENE.GHVT01088155.1~~GHVT01088155.1.p1  ORF type:complete len:132 (+),score=44.05 GHVT01088155.1:323-718(+)
MATRYYSGAMPCRKKGQTYTVKRKRNARDTNALPLFICSEDDKLDDNQPAESLWDSPSYSSASLSSFSSSLSSSSFSFAFSASSSSSAQAAPWAVDGPHAETPPFFPTNSQRASSSPSRLPKANQRQQQQQ